MNSETTRRCAAAALALCALVSTAGTANAEPDVESIVNTTCAYPQVDAALTAEAPDVADELHTSPLVAMWVQNMLNSPPEQRRDMIAQVQAFPELQQYAPAINQVAVSCQNY